MVVTWRSHADRSVDGMQRSPRLRQYRAYEYVKAPINHYVLSMLLISQ